MRERLASRLCAFAVFVTVAVVYSGAWSAAFVWDDHGLVEGDSRCRDHLAACFTIPFLPPSPFLDVSSSYWRPLVTLTFALSTSAPVQHLLNIGIHALNAVLLFVVARRFGVTVGRAGVASVVWALHPRLVESVVWVVGRTDMLATTFVLAAFAVWPEPGPSTPSRPRIAVASLFVFGALLTKEVALAGVIALAAMTLARRRGRASALALVAPVALYLVARLAVVGLAAPASSVSREGRLLTVFESFGRYAAMTCRFWDPWSLRGAMGVIAPFFAALGVLVLGLLVIAVLYAARERKVLPLGGLVLALAAFAFVSHVVPVPLHGAVTADRLLYLPLAGLALAASSAAPSRPPTRAAGAACLLLAGAFAWAVRGNARLFDDELTLWLTISERVEGANVGPRTALATVVRDRGLPGLACPLFASARDDLARTQRTTSTAYRRARENLGNCWLRTGRIEEAVTLFRELSREHERSGRVWLTLGYALLAQLDFDAADAAAARAGTLDEQLASNVEGFRRSIRAAKRARDELEANPADAPKRARFVALIGRGIEADEAWSRIVDKPSATLETRIEAATYLVRDGSLEAADRALLVCPECSRAAPSLAAVVAGRRALTRSILDNEARIARLAR